MPTSGWLQVLTSPGSPPRTWLGQEQKQREGRGPGSRAAPPASPLNEAIDSASEQVLSRSPNPDVSCFQPGALPGDFHSTPAPQEVTEPAHPHRMAGDVAPPHLQD